jgi:hypothetical protein
MSYSYLLVRCEASLLATRKAAAATSFASPQGDAKVCDGPRVPGGERTSLLADRFGDSTDLIPFDVNVNDVGAVLECPQYVGLSYAVSCVRDEGKPFEHVVRPPQGFVKCLTHLEIGSPSGGFRTAA